MIYILLLMLFFNSISTSNVEALDTTIDDLVNISDLNEMSILHNLRCRYREDKIYTNISSILISVNPFKLLPLYTPEMLDKYREHSRDLPPHIFTIAHNAYTNMLNNLGDQSVVISGESGAGKSEATKLILQFLADVSTRASKGLSIASPLEQQILAANPILEAFGNAKTLRNNNSSRFGKLITVNFDSAGCIMGGSIINYLLEKSRVVGQAKGERNYHIFYQLLSLVDNNPALAETLKLTNAELFNYLCQSGVVHIDGVLDDKDFEDMQNSMDILRFSQDEKDEMFRIIAGVLHFGNVKFKLVENATAEDASAIANMDVFEHACTLWGLTPEKLQPGLISKNVGTREVVLKTYNVVEAQGVRDAMTKRVYSELFEIVVKKINKELTSGKKIHKFIGVLDIFGFESFEVNSFEQLCINFCNEKLQFHFNEHIFKMEQSLYALEGINIPSSTFVDNQVTLDLLELKSVGIFSMCDEEINVPRGSDEGFLQKILQKYGDGKHSNFVRPKANNCKDFLKNFGVIHYAGVVYYNCSNFLEKNKDQLHPDIVNVLKQSTSPFIKQMFTDAGTATGGNISAVAAAKKSTVSSLFIKQLNDLVNTLNITFPHFVRCMKPNDDKVGDSYKAHRMLDQLRYAGLVEVCRIRKLGYPVRRAFDEFYKRYKCCDLSLRSTTLDVDALLSSLKSAGVLIDGEWAKGKTKVFMRTAQNEKLELAREAAFTKVVVVVQSCARGYINRLKLKRFKELIAVVKICIQNREEGPLTAAIDSSFELPWGGGHLKVIQEAKALLIRVRDENRIIKLLENAYASSELNSLKSALAAAQSLNPPFEYPLIEKVKHLIEKLETIIKVKELLLAAMEKRSLSDLVSSIEQAQQINLSCAELSQALTLKARLEQEAALIVKVVQATQARDLDLLNSVLAECVTLGIEGYPEVKAANKLKNELIAEIEKAAAAAERARAEQLRREEEERQERIRLEIQAKKDNLNNNLVQAIESRDAVALNDCLKLAIEVGLENANVTKAHAVLKDLEKATNIGLQIQAALDNLASKAERGITVSDIAPLKTAIEGASTLALPPHELEIGVEMYEIYQGHIQATAQLEKAIASKSREELKSSLIQAENLDMNTDIVAQARALHLTLENAYREQKAAANIAVRDEEPYDAAEEARKKRQELAKQARFDIKKYPHLRSPDDFAKGIFLHKAKVKEQFLVYQPTVLHRSLLVLVDAKTKNSENSREKLAIQMHKDLLGYMGDLSLPFPAMLAQDILRKGFEHKYIRDEIYTQIIKQLSNNPKSESIAKGWQMMCMCVGTFPPSYEFENYLFHFIIEKRDKARGAVVEYARYCLRTLEAILSNGDGTGFVPSVEEIQAYKERPPILATIYLVDNNVVTEDLPITPDLDVSKIVEMCAGWLDLRDVRVSTLGIFVYDLGDNSGQETNNLYDDLPRTPRPLRNEDFMGDIIVQKAKQKRKFKFVLKKKIFLPRHNYRGDDPLFERLVYLQAEDDTIVQGNIQIDDEERVSHVAALSMAVAYGDTMGSTVDELVEAGLNDFIIPSWRDRKQIEHWGTAILENRDALIIAETEDLQDQFLQLVQESPLYGIHWFFVHNKNVETTGLPEPFAGLPYDLLLGFNHEGMQMYTVAYKFIALIPYGDIVKWGGSTSKFSIIISLPGAGEYEFIVITAQAPDMAAIILDNIHAVMEELTD